MSNYDKVITSVECEEGKMIKNKSLILSVALVLVLFSTIGLSACGGSSPTTTHPITTTNPPITTTIPPTTTTVPPTTTTPPTTTVPPTTTSGSGAAIYNSTSANCTFCHGANRQGVTLGTTVLGPPIPASLQFITSQTEAQLATFLSTHATGSTLTADQRNALATFLKTP
jgi:mono/diheme cytochrome c family protein